MTAATSPYLNREPRQLADALAEHHSCRRRYYVTLMEGDGDYNDYAVWATDKADAERQGREMCAGRRALYRWCDDAWTDVRFPDGKEMPRTEFLEWCRTVRGRDVQQLIGKQVGKAAA